MTELEIISSVIRVLDKNVKSRTRYASELENFQNRKIHANSNKYRLGVIGVTSSGKSTMINALLGEFLLPAVARPSSSQLVSCFRSNNRRAQIFFQNGRSRIVSGCSLNKSLIEKYADEGVNTKNKEKVKQIEISTPNFPFDENLIFIDSPGLDAYGYAGHEQLTMNSLLPTIDFCIFVTTCKTNSDDKMLSVLNTIAEYEKPIVIVQNMIDSLKPSLDGKKSVSDVAQDHRVRVERIVNRSNIKDKSKVSIVQISAINALNARQNKLRSKSDNELLEKSNYDKLVRVVKTAFEQVIPVVEGHRLLFLKKEITRIAKAALDDGAGAYALMPKFEYEGVENDYEDKKESCIKKLNDELAVLQSLLQSVRTKSSFSETDINRIKGDSDSCESMICTQMKLLNSSLNSICKKLNIDSRDIVLDFRFNKPELQLKKKTEVVKNGYWKKGKRLWYTLWTVKKKDVWIETSYTREVTDVNGSIQNAIDYINNSIRIFNQTINRWQKSLELTERKLYSEIENRRAEYKARQDKALDCQTYLHIGKDLQSIADSIKCIQEKHTEIKATKTDVNEIRTYRIKVDQSLLPMYKLSDLLRIKIHNATFGCCMADSSFNYLIGWDENCEARLLQYAFNQCVSSKEIVQGINVIVDSIYLIHKPVQNVHFKGNRKNVIILVNATQYGAAMNEIVKLKLTNALDSSDHAYFVIQDFYEIMNGNSVSETLLNIKTMRLEISTNARVQCKFLLLHDNPIFNLAAAEAQTTGCTTQADEIRILNNLQTRFNYLLPHDRNSRNTIEEIIKIIIQQLGKI